MILNKTTEYSLAVLCHMATSSEKVFSAEYLHEKLEIPRRYLRKLLTDLSRLGYIRSAKGRKGGFVFAIPLQEISLAGIINRVEGSEIMGSCLMGHSKCKEEKPCIMHETWLEARSKMISTLANTTLFDLYEKNLALQNS